MTSFFNSVYRVRINKLARRQNGEKGYYHSGTAPVKILRRGASRRPPGWPPLVKSIKSGRSNRDRRLDPKNSARHDKYSFVPAIAVFKSLSLRKSTLERCALQALPRSVLRFRCCHSEYPLFVPFFSISCAKSTENYQSNNLKTKPREYLYSSFTSVRCPTRRNTPTEPGVGKGSPPKGISVPGLKG